MALAPGTRLGPYEVLAPVGAGGMGEVYRAKDSRLGRDVAIKVLPDEVAADPKTLARFEAEARAVAALSHPNILALFDVGESAGIQYAVTELLEGETLRAVVNRGPLAVKRVLEIVVPLTDALAVAHVKGIVHRDVKPENVFVTKDGHVKLLDFGLAALRMPLLGSEVGTKSPTVPMLTDKGSVIGTVAYMAPEQARGEVVDFRADQFSLGVMLYEMIAGERPFRGDSAVDILSAIVRDEPEPLLMRSPKTPAPVAWIVERLMTKDPVGRYDSTRDLTRELAGVLAHLSDASLRSSQAPIVVRRGANLRRALLGFAALVVITAVGVAIGVFSGRRTAGRGESTFQQLTFKRGNVTNARFTQDGRTVVYSAVWGEKPSEVFSIGLDSMERTGSIYGRAAVLAVSRKGELALARADGLGTLALAPLTRGSLRDLGVVADGADFGPDGGQLAIAVREGRESRVEYPVGAVRYRSAKYIDSVRVSPSGKFLAFLEYTGRSAAIIAIERSGKEILRSGPFTAAQGLAWSPDEREVWFAGNPRGSTAQLRAVGLDGRLRFLLAGPLDMELFDVALDGRLLVGAIESRRRILMKDSAGASDREITAQASPTSLTISPDGSRVAFSEEQLSGANVTYLASASSTRTVRLGAGAPFAFSSDGRTLVAVQPEGPAVVLHPVASGLSTLVRLDGFVLVGPAGMLPDSNDIWFVGSQRDRPLQTWQVAISGGTPRALTPEGTAALVTADGASLLFGRDRGWWIQPLSGGEAKPLDGILPGQQVATWTKDGKPLFVYFPSECPVKVFRVDPQTGSHKFFRQIGPADCGGVERVWGVVIAQDGEAAAYVTKERTTDLHLIEGLK